jgi:hypothetical protein
MIMMWHRHYQDIDNEISHRRQMLLAQAENARLLAHSQPGRPPLFDRLLARLGAALVQLGTRLQHMQPDPAYQTRLSRG